ncbi:hypothetical protein NSQ77_06870 [Oceanobacillus sp. FSL K6-2867]|uniref:hypothetical protein n=1 Tax=Oceanobacillus sp. FSL K6-2867 TaxID=2954748 RepID=UPI0030D74B69
MFSLTERFKRLGFIVGVPELREGRFTKLQQVYVKDLTKHTSLIIEGSQKKGYSTYRYTFYKATYIKDGQKINEKVYVEDASPLEVLRKVTSFLSYIERG